ncbi:MAG: hypothetical protein A4E57_02762 [Syntrophorhabdaceae bacterium PtaU1.Bin034]|nr:MAG: hypothetical protein A4E57_02762 [Syntrophorhabdaceae bacterium PtaU1.Bin034]
MPMLPASVGVKKPRMRPMTRRTKVTAISATSGSDPSLALQVDLSPFGPIDGLILDQP